MPLDLKTIKPINSVYGHAGGTKYIHNNIFFKIPLESCNVYSSLEHCIKSCKNEYYANLEIIRHNIGIHSPLTVLIDYLGWRILAKSLIPISSTSLVYGSQDGGNTILNTDPYVNACMQKLANRLYLLTEFIWNNNETNLTKLHTSCDIEVHLGTDSRYYILDTARLFPPTKMDVKGSYLYQLFRPEFLYKHKRFMCPDAYSGFNIVNKNTHEETINQATKQLLEVAIPHFSKLLARRESLFSNMKVFSGKEEIDNICFIMKDLKELIASIKRWGINIRYLSIIISNLKESNYKNILICELITRCIKDYFKSILRSCTLKGFMRCTSTISNFLEYTFGNNDASYVFWDVELPKRMEKRLNMKVDYHFFYNKAVLKNLIVLRFLELNGIQIPSILERKSFVFDHEDIYLNPKVYTPIDKMEVKMTGTFN